MIFLYTIGDALVLSREGDLVTIGPDGTVVLKGKPLPLPGAYTPRAKHKPRNLARRKPVATCEKCGRVFFHPQGVKRHVKFCKGTAKGYVPK